MQVQTRLWPQLIPCFHGALRCPLRKAQPSESMPRFSHSHALHSGAVTAAEVKQLPRDLFLTVSFLRPTRAILVFYSPQRLVPRKAVSGAQERPGLLSPRSPIRAQGCRSRSGGLVHRHRRRPSTLSSRVGQRDKESCWVSSCCKCGKLSP